MYNPYSLEGKKILITGGSSGIGRQTAIECSRLGAEVILTARREQLLVETLSLLDGNYHSYITADLASEGDVDKLVSSVQNINGLVCNAGIQKVAPVPYIKEEDLIGILKVNTIAPVMLVKSLLRGKKLQHHSSIVFTSSVAGVYSVEKANSMYSISKAAINGFMKNAALDLANKGIRCNSVNPGMIETGFYNDGAYSHDDIAKHLKQYPLGRYGTSRDVALGITYLLSDAASWITGSSLVIDGGFTL